jgi:hypothetical protein
MSEQLHNPEHAEHAETLPEAAEHIEAHHKHEKLGEQPEKAPDDSIERIRSTIEQQALQAKDEMPRREREEPAVSASAIGKDAKYQALNRTLKHVRERLPFPEKGLSTLIHQPVIDVASELSGKTVGRPSGILGGGICAFLGSLLFVYLAKHYGFQYNYLLFLLFFVGGFAVGLVLEIMLWLLFKLRRKA